jgi:hypothetical protein
LGTFWGGGQGGIFFGYQSRTKYTFQSLLFFLKNPLGFKKMIQLFLLNFLHQINFNFLNSSIYFIFERAKEEAHQLFLITHISSTKILQRLLNFYN